MFGIAVASLTSLSDEEKRVYQGAYCGLCAALKRQYGQIGRNALNYDLTFLELLYDSLYEPDRDSDDIRCILHPLKKVPCDMGPFSSYCATLSIALAYQKCLDDIEDDNSLRGRAGAVALNGAYLRAKDRLPGHCQIIEEAMSAIRHIEQAAHSAFEPSPDSASMVFGEMLSFCMECVPGEFPDIWSEMLGSMGFWLGRFIYMMDAAVDFQADLRSGSYNPFICMGHRSPDVPFMRDVLGGLIANTADCFERLPIVRNAHLLQAILYQGVWQKFNQQYSKND